MKKSLLLLLVCLAAGFTLGGTFQTALADVAIGQKISAFSLSNTAGTTVSVGEWNSSKATVVVFVATRCPISLDYDSRIKRLSDVYSGKGVRFFGINSNKQENAEEMGEHAREKGFAFPVLKDTGNKVADLFGAQVTPEIYVINGEGILVYKGQFDDSREEAAVKSRPLATALDAILSNKVVSPAETRAFGCSIKREK